MIKLRPLHFGRIAYGILAIVLIPNSTIYSQINQSALRQTQPKVVKIYGSGGFANLHSYQTGTLISADGLIVTVWSHVLDGKITVVDSQGKRAKAEFIGMDPVTDLALVKIEGARFEHFDLTKDSKVFSGQIVFGISNLFGVASKSELLSVMRGVVSTITQLDGKFGAAESAYSGNVIVLDLITNNPGAAGGVIVNNKGDLIGLIGKELKNKQSGLWLNFCLPVKAVAESVQRIQKQQLSKPATAVPAAESFTFSDIGLTLVPKVLPTTRPYVDRTQKNSVARRLGFQPDDLIVFIGGQPVRTLSELNALIKTIDRDASFQLTIKRANKLINLKVARNIQ